MSYREVIPDQTDPSDWKEIALNTGKYNLKVMSFVSCSTEHFNEIRK